MRTDFHRQAKVVLVTGATTGIGASIALVLAEAGHRVWGTGRKSETSLPLPGKPGSIALDVTKPATVHAAISTIVAKEGQLDAVVNNAGIGMMGAMGDTSEEELLTVYNTNVVGLHTVSKAAIPHLIDTQGHLLHVGSVAGVVGLPFRGVYCSSKAAVELIAEAQSMELSRHGVRVTVLRPGDFKTAINANRLRVAHPNHTVNPGFEAVCDAVNAEVAHAKDPADMGKAVLKLLGQKKPPLYITVAPPLQRLAIRLKRVLPDRVFEALIARRYPLD
ncbi:SDR family NAD(P)-dependent oxidoreductase [Flavobacteriales bacterium]|nr:SDR family NAD(P)-dependent oxidoreductase [Flavobacteriales bacterium]MDA9863958.1 SDR family NAD(P)-dependent oxidoreductase [Flavobacteriales bacterium]